MLGILALFYATDQKPLAMSLMRAVNPIAGVLPWLTQSMRFNALNVRLYDLMVVTAMAIQCCAIGFAIDMVTWIRRARIHRSR